MAKRWQSFWKTHWNYREIEFHNVKSDKGLFWKSLVAEEQLQEKLQEAVCCQFFKRSVELLENVSSTFSGLAQNENCPSQITKDAFSTTEGSNRAGPLKQIVHLFSRVSFVTFSCCVTIVVPFLECINIDSFGVIICYNLVMGNTPPKIFFPCFLEMKIRASWGYVLNSKSATREPIWLKFGQLTVR